MNRGRILVVEDRASLRRLVERALTGEGWTVSVAEDAAAGLAQIDRSSFDLVLTDLKLPGESSGLDVLEHVRQTSPGTPVVVMTAFGTVSTAVRAMKAGAIDFLEKPIEIDDLFDLVNGILGSSGTSEPFRAGGDGPAIVGQHPTLRAAIRLLERVAPTDATVLISGASGTGKELFARSLHALSSRCPAPFVAVNCAAIPESLLESELFGHEKGAFTGAHRRQSGRFERASGGTLFLDEIGELATGVQAKVLRVLEDGTYEPVGGSSTIRADVRLVAATNRDLGAMVDRGEFRADLFYRLDVFPIRLPSLSERRSDVPALVDHLLGEHAARHGVERPRLSDAAVERLTAAPWPGNVRQLGNLLERLVILHQGESVGPREVETMGDAGADDRRRVEQALRETDGDKRAAAERLGVSYRTLQRRIRALDLEGFPRYRS